MKPSWKPHGALLLVAFTTLLLYARTLSFDFVTYDDPVYVTDNPEVRAGLTGHGILYAFTTGATGTWQPLALLSHMLDCQLYSGNAAGHHATSAVLHALNTFLLGAVLLRMTRAAGPSVFVAAVFGVHPLHVESVAWISERKDVLSTFFFMLTLWFYAMWTGSLQKRWLAAATSSMAIGLLAKPMLVTLPFILLLLDYWPLQRVRRERLPRSIGLLAAEKLPMFVLAAAASICTIAVQHGAQATSSLTALPLPYRLENAAVAYVRYIGKTLWPDHLIVYYPHPLGSVRASTLIAAIALLSAITIAAWKTRQRAPYVLTGWLWYLGSLVPVIGVVQVGTQAIADRYMYIPMTGLSIMVAWGARDLVAGLGGVVARRVEVTAAMAVLLALTALAWPQIGVWRNSETLYRHTLASVPDNAVGNMGLGLLLVKQRRYAEAIPYLKVAREKKHRVPEAEFHLGIAYQEQQQPAEAERHYRAAVSLDPAYSQAWNNLGVTLDAQHKTAEALSAFEQAAATGPQNQEAQVNFVRYLIRTGRVDEALQRAQSLVARFPDSGDLRSIVAMLSALRDNTRR